MKTLLIPWHEFVKQIREIPKPVWLRVSKRVGAVGGVLLLAYLAALIGLRIWANQGLDRLLTLEFHPAPAKATNLIVVVHAYTSSNAKMAGVRQATREVRTNSDILMVQYPASPFSNADCFQIAEQLCQTLNAVWNTNRYQGVEFVGYSMGALLTRKAYVYGLGYVEDLDSAPDAPPRRRAPQPWVTNTTRFVLLAGMNRGWTTRSRPNGMDFGTWAVYSAGKGIALATGTGKLIRQCEAGEPFVANLRMQWLEAYRTAKARAPLMVQLLGDDDNLVTREDERDVSIAKNFVWVQLSGTKHQNAAEFGGDTNTLSGFYAAERKSKFQKALGGEETIKQLRRASLEVPSAEDESVVSGVVVLHGIRDLGNEWTSQFEDALQARFMTNHPPDQKLCIYRPTYGYFDMISFLSWPERQGKVRWFMDELTELQAKYPNMTNLSFIGHSHGTYVLANALKKYKALKLDRAVFAGSVVPQYFNWASPALSNRIDEVRNYVGSSDLVVAWLPRLFELCNGDLGSAGFNGFQMPSGMELAAWTNFMKQTKYVSGAHSAAITPGDTITIGSIASFVIEGQTMEPTKVTGHQPWWIKAGSYWLGCLFVWTLMVCLVLLVGIYATWAIRKLLPAIVKRSGNAWLHPVLRGFVIWMVYFVCIVWLLKQV